jgi:hypothetical protein
MLGGRSTQAGKHRSNDSPGHEAGRYSARMVLTYSWARTVRYSLVGEYLLHLASTRDWISAIWSSEMILKRDWVRR